RPVVPAHRLLFILPPLPPSSTLFPYTTLFRSVVVAKSGGPLLETDAVEAVRTLLLPQAHLIMSNLPEAAVLLGEDLFDGVEQMQDRKSTRLNSSHVSISYAVFCLKKKKKQ